MEERVEKTMIPLVETICYTASFSRSVNEVWFRRKLNIQNKQSIYKSNYRLLCNVDNIYSNDFGHPAIYIVE